MKIIYSLLLIILFAGHGFAQTISNIKVEPDGDIIHIYYDLEGTLHNQLYKVSLYSSHNDLLSPLSLVSGNIGDTVTAGSSKKIDWKAKSELTRYNGEITFEVEATLIFSPIVIINPLVSKTYKRGKTYTFSWKGGVQNEAMQLELFNGTAKVAEVKNLKNTKKYGWKIPTRLKPGDNYQLKVSTSNKPDNFNLSHPFIVRRRYPWVIKMIPVAAVIIPAALIYLIGPPDHTLPKPPGLPE